MPQLPPPHADREVHDLFGAGDKVVSRWTITGTHRGPFLGIAPTNNRVRIDGIAIDLFEAGVRVDGGPSSTRSGCFVSSARRTPTDPSLEQAASTTVDDHCCIGRGPALRPAGEPVLLCATSSNGLHRPARRPA